MSRDIVLGIEIEAEPKVVFDRVASASGVASFWTSDVDGEDDAMTLGFPSAPSRLPVAVTRSDPPQAIGWTFGGDWPFWGGSTAAWTFQPGRLGTDVLFQHIDYGEGMPDLQFGMVAMTWANVVGALKRAAETGVADPALG
jgi:uncharacterized protein YndB with AHSA1/START domain